MTGHTYTVKVVVLVFITTIKVIILAMRNINDEKNKIKTKLT